MTSSAQSRLLTFAAVALFIFGTAARVRQYLVRASFWHDEAFIVLNIRDHSVGQLVGKLDYFSAAPPLFLMALKGMSRLGGVNEYSLRFVPLLCGLLGVIVFGVLAWRTLPAPAALFAFGLFALFRRFVEYSAQTKQYCGDALVASLILLAAMGKPASPPLPRLIRAALLASLLVWFAHPAAIMFAGVSVVLTYGCSRRGGREFLMAIACNALFAASFVPLYFFSIRLQHSAFLDKQGQWAESLADWSVPRKLPGWMGHQLFEFVQAPYRWAGPFFALLILGAFAWAYRRKDTSRWLACALPILIALLAGLLRQYPFDGTRLSLFLMPSLFLLVGAGSALVWEILPAQWRPVWWILPGALLGHGIALAIPRFIHPRYESNIRPAVEYARARRQPGDALVLIGQHWTGDDTARFSGRHLEALCYWPHAANPIYTRFSKWNEIREKRFWILTTFDPNDSKERRDLDRLRKELNQIASERDHLINEHGGAAFLFERADPVHPARATTPDSSLDYPKIGPRRAEAVE